MQTINPYSPGESSAVERMNGVIVQKVRMMLVVTNLSLQLWDEALLYATETLNVMPTVALKTKTLYEALSGGGNRVCRGSGRGAVWPTCAYMLARINSMTSRMRVQRYTF